MYMCLSNKDVINSAPKMGKNQKWHAVNALLGTQAQTGRYLHLQQYTQNNVNKRLTNLTTLLSGNDPALHLVLQ